MAALAHEIGTFTFSRTCLRALKLSGGRLLEPVDAAGLLERATEPDRGRHVEAAMRVDEDLDLRPGRLADKSVTPPPRARPGVHAAVEIAITLLACLGVGDGRPW